MGLFANNVSMAQRAISWAMFINIIIVPITVGPVYVTFLTISILPVMKTCYISSTACFHRENEIVIYISKYVRKMFAIIIYILFGWVLVYFEEVLIGYRMYLTHQKFLAVLVTRTLFSNLGQGRKHFFSNYYDDIDAVF